MASVEQATAGDLFTDHVDEGDWVEIDGERRKFLGVSDDGWVQFKDPFGGIASVMARDWQEHWKEGALVVVEGADDGGGVDDGV